MITLEKVEAVRARVHEELREQGLSIVPADERVIRAALPLVQTAELRDQTAA